MSRVTLIVGCLLAVACGASTGLVRTWREPTYTGRGEGKKVLVVALTPKAHNQQTFETAMAERLLKMQLEPYRAYDVLPRGKMADQETVAGTIQKLGIDFVVVSKLVAIRTEAEYVPAASYAPAPAYRAMYPYYATGYAMVYSPGYVTQTNAVYLETNAYDVRAEKLVWSGLSRTFDYSSVDSISTSAAKTICDALLDQGIF